MAAAAAAFRRVLLQSGYCPRRAADLDALILRGPSSHHVGGGNLRRHVSQLRPKNGRPAFLVDTLALVKKLEAQGIPSKQAETITSAIIEVLNDSLENVAQSFVSQGEIQKEYHFSMLQRETEKIRSDIEKMRSELRYEIDEAMAGQRLEIREAAKYDVLKSRIDAPIHSQPRPPKPAHSIGEEFLGRFMRNAGLVAAGVSRNPDWRRPK